MVMAQLMGAYMFVWMKVTDFLWDIHKIHYTVCLLARRVIVNFTFHRENWLTHRLTENGNKKPNVCLHRNFAFLLILSVAFLTFCILRLPFFVPLLVVFLPVFCSVIQTAILVARLPISQINDSISVVFVKAVYGSPTAIHLPFSTFSLYFLHSGFPAIPNCLYLDFQL